MKKIYDISQEVFSCAVYPGDPRPEKQIVYSTGAGDLYNLTSFAMCAHNGTHVDAPFHFIQDGKTIEQIPLDSFVGHCSLLRHEGEVSAADAQKMLEKARNFGAAERLLIAGDAVVTAEAAAVFAQAKLNLLGNESQSVGPEETPMQVHLILLHRGIALLEGIVLHHVPVGHYFLSAAPLNLAGADGAPCRAYLIDWKG